MVVSSSWSCGALADGVREDRLGDGRFSGLELLETSPSDLSMSKSVYALLTCQCFLLWLHTPFCFSRHFLCWCFFWLLGWRGISRGEKGVSTCISISSPCFIIEVLLITEKLTLVTVQVLHSILVLWGHPHVLARGSKFYPCLF